MQSKRTVLSAAFLSVFVVACGGDRSPPVADPGPTPAPPIVFSGTVSSSPAAVSGLTTPLHSAAFSGGNSGIQGLIDAGADPNAPDEYGRTPLHLAAANGHGDTVAALLKGGARADVRDFSGRTAYELAIAGGHEGTAEVLASPSPPRQVKNAISGLNPRLKFLSAESFGRAIGSPAIVVSSEHVHIFAAKEYEEAVRTILPYLEQAYEELDAIVGMHPEYDFAVYHFSPGHPEAFGGTSAGAIYYDDANLRLAQFEEWREYHVPHVSGYIEEMAHNFVSATHVQFGWEMVGWSIGIAASLKVAGNPILERSLASTREGQAETFRRYVEDSYRFPADIAPNQVDRIHAYLLWQAEQQYGPNFWRDFFTEVRKKQPEFIQASEIGNGYENRNARYQISWRCIDRLPGVNFRDMLQQNEISLTTDIKALNPEDPGWNRKLK